ncbi:molybdopterin molybdotransferase MoeA [Campylobacter corcagiensis]|uniref:Molybdopterin molybdenumtransferase n=1 Tax=Campylobacter corcagiensis TaxID=1448857 RepID=A0A7M1LDZ8_9BACT|nr:molybdopterin molybdotransferase MoeA [Campylobacter corcagiensis]QKF65319.1 molybdopterin molybdenumtransferase [Campylobacter corcagiensis]QOQ86551.1 molybdopterin molybdotransferase MoeA [Campylobacter corcagiensis]
MEFMEYEKTLDILKNNLISWDRVEKVAITNALNRYLAVDIIAKENYPKSQTASMDGYAIKFNSKCKEYKILGSNPAGEFKFKSLSDFECIKTFTGSLMPQNADTLVPVENVKVTNDKIEILKNVNQGFAVRKIGESYKKGEILLKKGTKISYSEIALLAEIGEFHISVFVKPKVCVMASGSEIKDLGEPLENEAQIRSSNHVAIASMMQLMGCEAIILPIVKDEKETVKKAILNSLKFCDILITTGGVSMGDYDFIKEILDSKTIINGAAIKPGRHIKIAKFNEKYIFALPGFPYSAMVMCVLYVRVLVESFFCATKDHFINAVLENDYTKKSPFLEFSACSLKVDENGIVRANLEGKKNGSSAIVNNLNNEAALLVVPKELKGYKKGDVVQILKMI